MITEVNIYTIQVSGGYFCDMDDYLQNLCRACPANSVNLTGNMFGLGTSRFHDDEANVTCWTWKNANAGGLSCIPDQDIYWRLK